MAYNRYRRKEQMKRQYTFTHTKAVVGFVLSALFSICLSTYFDRYGLVIFRQVKKSIGISLNNLGQASTANKTTAPAKQSLAANKRKTSR